MTMHNAGDLIGDRYEVLCFVGEGGMQEVYRARDRLLDRDVALKCPKNKSAAKRFRRSAVVSAKVNHANVAKTLDYVEVADTAYLIEEFIDGKDLSRVLKEHVPFFDPLLAARILHHLAKGLAASHHAGVIHRDFKPSNIMSVGGDNLVDVKITDFGIAKMAEEEIAEAIEGGEGSLTASQTAIGALPYMAPEMVRSMKDAGKPADVWSLGAMIFELMSGKKPFGAGLAAVEKILAGKIPSIPNIVTSSLQFKPSGDELYSVIQNCMQIEPEKRPTADELVEHCESLCYPVAPREFGTVSSVNNSYWGFITPDDGKSVFYHVESLYGASRMALNDRVWFSRHFGGGSDRAFPILKINANRS
jgi:eukaryotic-like serine/threonine-protein kinase